MKMRSENPSYAIRNTEYHGVNDLLELNHDVTLNRNGNLLGKITAGDCLTDTRHVLDLCL